jgi:hypothetical protein
MTKSFITSALFASPSSEFNVTKLFYSVIYFFGAFDTDECLRLSLTNALCMIVTYLRRLDQSVNVWHIQTL